MRATLNRPDGSVLHVEGSISEIAQLFLQAPGQVQVPLTNPPSTKSGRREISEETRKKMSDSRKAAWALKKKTAKKAAKK